MKVAENKIKMSIKASGKFELHEGVRQSDSLSLGLFNLILESTIRKAMEQDWSAIYINKKKRHCLAFADDLVIMTRIKRELEEIIKRLEEQFKKVGQRH